MVGWVTSLVLAPMPCACTAQLGSGSLQHQHPTLGPALQRCPLCVSYCPVHQVALLPSLKASKYFINYANPHGGQKVNCTVIALPLYPFYPIYFADGIFWPAASSSQLVQFWIQARLWLGRLQRTHWENTEHTDLAVGSQLCGPKAIKVVVLLKLLTWLIIFTKRY